MYGVRCAPNTAGILLITKYFEIMKKLLNSWRNALYILLTCVLCAGCGLRADIKAVSHKKQVIDSLQIEFDKADSLCKYYQSKYDAYSPIDTFWYYRTKAGQQIDIMIKTNNERMRVRNAR